MAPILEGSGNVPPQAFQQWNDPQGTKLIALNRDGSVSVAGGITFSDGTSQTTAAAGGGSGTVTSVALTSPGVVYTVSGSPITTSGTLALNLIAQTANTVLAGPATGGALNPTFRALVAADLPAGTSALQTPVVLSGGSDAIDPHTSATYIVNSAGVDSMTIIAPTVTTDDGKIIKFTTNTAPSHTLTFTGGHLRSGGAGVTTATFAAAAGCSLQIMAWQGNWYVIAQNLMASFS